MASELPTPSELATIAQQKLRSELDPNGTGAVDLHPGSGNDLAISVMTALANRVSQYAADRVGARSIASATGDDLAALAADIYQDSAKGANAATGTLVLQRTGTAQTVIPQGTRFAAPATATTPGIIFTADADVPVAAAAMSGVNVNVTCVQTGTVGNIQLSAITNILDGLQDTTWTITPSSGACAGGAEAETDDQFRTRLQKSAFDDSKRRGTRKAIETGALQVPGIENVTVVEPLDGTVLVYVGDASYASSTALQNTVAANLDNWRAFGIPAMVRGYSVSTVTLLCRIYMSRPTLNYNVPAIQAQALANIQNYFNGRQRPDEVFGNAILAALVAAHPETQTASIDAMTCSGTTQPDAAFNIHRQADSNAPLQMPRYIISPTSIQINIAEPQ